MLLLLAPALPAQRGARPAGALLHRSGAAAPYRSHHTGVHVLRRILARQLTTLGTRDSRQESSWPTHTLPTAATTTFRITVRGRSAARSRCSPTCSSDGSRPSSARTSTVSTTCRSTARSAWE